MKGVFSWLFMVISVTDKKWGTRYCHHNEVQFKIQNFLWCLVFQTIVICCITWSKADLCLWACVLCVKKLLAGWNTYVRLHIILNFELDYMTFRAVKFTLLTEIAVYSHSRCSSVGSPVLIPKNLSVLSSTELITKHLYTINVLCIVSPNYYSLWMFAYMDVT
jgi:hypothetical protein